jgi:hypothetical protein
MHPTLASTKGRSEIAWEEFGKFLGGDDKNSTALYGSISCYP